MAENRENCALNPCRRGRDGLFSPKLALAATIFGCLFIVYPCPSARSPSARLTGCCRCVNFFRHTTLHALSHFFELEALGNLWRAHFGALADPDDMPLRDLGYRFFLSW